MPKASDLADPSELLALAANPCTKERQKTRRGQDGKLWSQTIAKPRLRTDPAYADSLAIHIGGTNRLEFKIDSASH
jgi:hypothetical protein